MSVGATPTKFNELTVGGGYDSAAKGLDPVGGFEVDDDGNVLTNGTIYADKAITSEVGTTAPTLTATTGVITPQIGPSGDADLLALAANLVTINGALTPIGATTITSGSINNVTVGAATPSTGAFTTLSATGTVSANTIEIESGVTATVFNTAATTVNAFGAATALTLGATSGTTMVRNDLLGNQHAAFGAAATISTTQVLRIAENPTTTSGSIAGLQTVLNPTPTGDSSANYRALGFTIVPAQTYNYTGIMRGVLAEIFSPGSTKTTTAVNVFDASWGRYTSGQTGTITDLKLLRAGVSGGGIGAATNLYGLYLDDISAGGTLNYAIYTNAGEVRFGGNLTLASGVLSGGVSGTTRGALTAFHGSGSNTAGYVQLYSKGGTPYFFFVTDAGVLRVHTAAPTADTDGSAV